jgi:phosphoglycolate phosphatase
MKWGILFDLDGTLLDTLEDLADATNYALRQFGLPERSLDYIRSVIGNGALRQITLSLPGKADDPDPQEALKVYKAYYNTHCNIKTRPYPGIPAALAQLREEYPLAIVTNKPHTAAGPLCAEHFPGIYAMGESAGIARKPAPDMVYKAMDDLGVDRCVYVGDSEVDIATASNAGMPCLTVTWGLRNRQELEKASARYYCDKAEELCSAIQQIIEENC